MSRAISPEEHLQKAQAEGAIQPGLTPNPQQTNRPDILNGSIEIDGVRYLSPSELDRLDLDSKILYLFLLTQQQDNQKIGKKIAAIDDVGDKVEGAGEIFSIAAGARSEAGKDSKTKPPEAVVAFADQHNLSIGKDTKYSREDWDVNMELIQKKQNDWIFDSKTITYDLDKIMNQAATNMNLATKMLGTLQSMREKTLGGLQFR